MSEGNLISWADSQAVWVQVFLGLVLFFIGLPLIIFLISELFGTVGQFFSSIAKSQSTEYKDRSLQRTTHNEDEFSDEILLHALCRMQDGRETECQVREYLKGMRSAEKSALKKNPAVVRIVEKMRNDSIEQGQNELPRP